MALNKDQIAAAAHTGGHALVLAGPGTGKTSTLVGRHAFLRLRQKVDPDGIVAISYTSAAADEMKARIGTNAPPRAWIGTFHGICLRLLKRFNVEAHLAKNFKLIDPNGQRSIFNDLGIEWDEDDGNLGDIIGRWKDSLIDPDQAASEAARTSNVVLRKAAAHYEAYEAELRKRGHLDFADLMVRATWLIANGDKASKFVTERLPHWLVDEFQDVNMAQIEFLLAVAKAGGTLWAVADDDQAIYGWRGGQVKYTVNFASYFPGARKYFLMTNYRCDPAVIAAANASIINNKIRVPKTLKPIKEHKPTSVVRVRSFAHDRDEAEWVASMVAKLIGSGAPPEQIGILFRSSSATAQLQQALEKLKIPFNLSGTGSFWELPEVVAMTEMLLAIENTDVQKGYKYRGGKDIIETMRGSGPMETATSTARIVGDQPPAGFNSERQATWLDTCYAVGDLAKTFSTAASFKEHVATMASKATSQAAGVAVTTIHSSKGLEWQQVFIIGAEAAMMPHSRTNDVEEERRLFYVAITRSKGGVDISYAKQRFGKTQAVSPFIGELANAPKGAVRFITEDILQDAARSIAKPGNAGPPPARPSALVNGKPVVAPQMKTYVLKDGRRSMIPPDER